MNDSKKESGLFCPVTGCPVKQVLSMTLAVFVVNFLFNWLYHGIFMKGAYEATASLWRSPEEMQAMFPLSLVCHAVIAFGVAGLYALYARHSSCGGACVKSGLKFGGFLGLVLGVMAFSSSIWMPIPQEIAVKWLIGDIIWGLAIGCALSFVCGLCCGCKKGA